MGQLLHQYFNIAFLMGKPQDLPGGQAQMKIGVFLSLATYVMALIIPAGLTMALLRAIIDLGCTALILHFALVAVGKRNRFYQAFGGFCGACAFINLAAVPIYAFKPDDVSSMESAFAWSDFLLLVWGLSLAGHVIRHTFEVSMVLSICISFTYFMLLSILISMLVLMNAGAPAAVSGVDWNHLFAATRYWVTV